MVFKKNKEVKLSQVIETIISQLIDENSKLKIEEVESDGIVVIEVEVDPEDVGKVLGRGGKVVDAIRTIGYAIASRRQKRFSFYVNHSDDMEDGKNFNR